MISKLFLNIFVFVPLFCFLYYIVTSMLILLQEKNQSKLLWSYDVFFVGEIRLDRVVFLEILPRLVTENMQLMDAC